jgi:hypothetical protein
MKIVVRVELITDWGDVNTIEVGRIEGDDFVSFDNTPRCPRSPLASTRLQPRTPHRHFAVHGAQHCRATVLVAQGHAAAPTMGLRPPG